MEEPGTYEGVAPLTPVLLVTMLDVGRRVMETRRDRHQRRRDKAKTDRDRQFHDVVIAECDTWIKDCDRFLALFRGALLQELFTPRPVN